VRPTVAKARQRTQGIENLALDKTNALTIARTVWKICGTAMYLNVNPI